MTTDNPFPLLSPESARDRYVIKDDSWDRRFRPNFNEFIVVPLESARPIIKLPVPPGRTANHALFLLTGGAVELTIGHHAYTLSARDLVIIPALQIFSMTSIRADTTGFMCFFSQGMLLRAAGETDFGFLKLTSNPLIPLSTAQTGFITNVLERLLTEYTEHGATQTDLIRPYLLALLTEVNRAYAGTIPTQTDAGDRLVQRFMDALTQQIHHKRRVGDYADLLSVSPNHLNKVVRSRTGRSPSVWIDERLVLEAKVWLFQSSLTIAQIAAELGFDDQSTFGKLFRRFAHVSPGQFRSRFTGPSAHSTE